MPRTVRAAAFAEGVGDLHRRLAQCCGLVELWLRRTSHVIDGDRDAAVRRAIARDHDQLTAVSATCKRDAIRLAWDAPAIPYLPTLVTIYCSAVDLRRMGGAVIDIAQHCGTVAARSRAHAEALRHSNAAAGAVAASVKRVLLSGDGLRAPQVSNDGDAAHEFLADLDRRESVGLDADLDGLLDLYGGLVDDAVAVAHRTHRRSPGRLDGSDGPDEAPP